MAKDVIVKQVDVMGLMGALRTKGKAKLSDFATPIENETNNYNQKEDKDMTTTFKAADLIGKTIILGATGAKYVVKSVNGDKLECDFSNGKATIPMGVPVSQAEKFLASGTWKIEDLTPDPSPKGEGSEPETKDMSIRTEADVAEVDDILPVVTPKEKSEVRSKTEEVKPTAPETCNVKPETKAKPAENTGKTKIVVARVPRPGESADLTPDPSPKGEGSKPETRNLKPETKVKPETRNLKPETKDTGVLPTLTLAVYTTKRGEQAPRIDGFGGEEDPRWKKHYDEKIRLSNKREKAKRKNNKLHQEMKGKSAAEKEELLKKIIHVPSDPFGANYFIDHITGEKKYYFIMGAKYMGVAQQLVDAYNSGDEQAIALAEQAVIDCKSGIVAEIEASRNSNGNEPETCDLKPETKVYTAAEVADLIQRIAKSDPKALAEYDALTKKAA